MTVSQLTFRYSDAPQGSDEWVGIRVGRVTASRLGDWLAVSKRNGSPLAARTDYEEELAFERRFNIPFSRFVTSAMEDGMKMEPFLRAEYEKETKTEVETVGCYYTDNFAVSPDGLVGKEGCVEFKWMQDKSFSKVLAGEVSDSHYLQMQAQMFATQRMWCDYVVGNPNSKHMVIQRIKRDQATIERIVDSLDQAPSADSKVQATGIPKGLKIIPFKQQLTNEGGDW